MAATHKSSSNTGSTRRAPGSGGQGEYYHVEVRPGEDFVTYRTQDVGDPGHIQRVGGKRASGSWATVKWLISRDDAHLEGDTLVGDTREAKDLLKKIGSKVTHKSGDRFEASARRTVSQRSKTTTTPKKSQTSTSRK